MELLKIKELTKNFGGLRALDRVNIVIPNDKIISIIGPNGAGKTTLFNTISGLEKISGGKIVFKGVDISLKKISWMRKIILSSLTGDLN